MESEGQEENLELVYCVAENHKVMQPSHSLEENDAMLKASVSSFEKLPLKKEEFLPEQEISRHPKSSENSISTEDGKNQGSDVDVGSAGSLLQRNKTSEESSEPDCDSEASLSDVKDDDTRATKSSGETGKHLVNRILPRDCSIEDTDGDQNSKQKIMRSEMESMVDVKPMTSRRIRSLSPSAEIKDRIKRPARVCDFFAKGWCIRGSSCSFLHVKDGLTNADPEAEGDLHIAHQKREMKLEEGVKENVERPKTVSTPVPFTASLDSISLHASENPLQISMQNEEEASTSWHPAHEKEKFSMRGSLFPENRFAFNASKNNISPNLSSYSSRAEGMTAIRNQHMYKGYVSTVLSHSPNPSVVSPLSATSMPFSHLISTQLGCSLPKSTFSGSERDNFPLVGSSCVPPPTIGNKSKVSSYDWEPSVPFRPLFFITSMNASTPRDLYDPLCESIEIPNIGDGSLKASLLIHGSSIQASSQVQTYGDSAAVGKHMSDLNDDKSSVSSHNKIYENEPNRTFIPREEDSLAIKTETSETCVNYQNGKVGVGQHTFGVGDIQTEHDYRHHGEGSGHKKRRVGKDKTIHEMDADFQMDSSVHKETKALKIFRATLVDQVKELLKPFWHEGRLSKDAYITIVKKSVGKVVSTLEPHQIPTTEDTAKQYVSSCRVKIAKLVNGYVNKYGKS